MQGHVIILDTTGTIYTLGGIEKPINTIKEKNKNKNKEDKSKEKMKENGRKNRRNNLSCPPPAGEVANT